MVSTLQKWLFWEHNLMNISVQLVGLLTWFGETRSSYLPWRCFCFLGEVTGSQIEPFAQIWSHFPVPWFCGLRHDTLNCLGHVMPFQECLCGPSHLCDTHMLAETDAIRHLCANTWEKHWRTVPLGLFSGKMIYCLELQGQTFPGSRRLQQVFCGGCGQKPVHRQTDRHWAVQLAALAWSWATACKDWHSNKERTKYTALKVFWAGMCRDIRDTWGGRAGSSWCWHRAVHVDSCCLERSSLTKCFRSKCFFFRSF